MSVDVKVPSVGESVQEAQVFKWHVKNGDYIERDQVLLELETDKATVEIVAEASGAIQILKKEGESVHVGDILGKLDTSAQPSQSPTKKETPAKSTAEAKLSSASTSAPLKSVTQPVKMPTTPKPSLPISPAVGRMVAEHQINPADIQGSGRGGRVTKPDVIAHLGKTDKQATAQALSETPLQLVSQPAVRSSDGSRREWRESMSLLRRRIAERLLAAQQQAAILTTFNEIDMTNMMKVREQYKETFKEKYGVSLGFMSFFVKAAIDGLKAFPRVNGWIEGNDIVYHDYYDIGVAVSSDRGLVVPVVRDADKLSFAQIEQQVAEYAKRAREGKITVDELTGGTFTISNGGVFGSLLSTPILNPPQSGILGMHKIQERPVVVDGQIVIRKMMYVALSYDHRIVDGKEAVSFLVKIKECIEDPNRLVLGV